MNMNKIAALIILLIFSGLSYLGVSTTTVEFQFPFMVFSGGITIFVTLLGYFTLEFGTGEAK
jgi:multisubunit Na+/H+ antiporter MnhC subunit